MPMRSKLLVAFLLAAGCTTATPRPRSAADAQLRFEIARAIAADLDGRGPRRITGLGPVTDHDAVVFTEPTAAAAGATPRQEERWVRGPAGWQLAEGTARSADGRR